jgi:hypothetical protein
MLYSPMEQFDLVPLFVFDLTFVNEINAIIAFYSLVVKSLIADFSEENISFWKYFYIHHYKVFYTVLDIHGLYWTLHGTYWYPEDLILNWDPGYMEYCRKRYLLMKNMKASLKYSPFLKHYLMTILIKPVFFITNYLIYLAITLFFLTCLFYFTVKFSTFYSEYTPINFREYLWFMVYL